MLLSNAGKWKRFKKKKMGRFVRRETEKGREVGERGGENGWCWGGGRGQQR